MKNKNKETTKQKLLSLVRLDPPTTREQLIALCHETTKLTIDRDAASLALSEQLAALQAQHSPQVESLDGQIERNVKRLHAWAVLHREEFHGKQGLKVAGCTMEFRKGTGKVVAAVDDEAALNQILALDPEQYAQEQEQLIRIKCELNKSAVLGMAKTQDGAALLKLLGLTVEVEEKFSWSPAREDLAELPVESDALAA
jgi:phage host-nuclease inhibitor protein Gam